MIAVVVVNFRRPVETLQCLHAVAAYTPGPILTILVDNAPEPAPDQQRLEEYAASRNDLVHLINEHNAGFAAACNRAIDHALTSGVPCDSVVLLNNDALPQPGWLDDWLATPADRTDMGALPMFSKEDPHRIDSLGIAFYQGGIAANRLRRDVPLLGPCGGAACFRMDAIRRLLARTGEVFPASFFCYAEDTDLAMRAALLGLRCSEASGPGVLHHGSLSSGGAQSEFVLYHGLRNSIRVLRRAVPGPVLLRNLGWIVLAQLAIVAKYVGSGRARLLWSIYRGVASHWKADGAMRQRLRAEGLLGSGLLGGRVAPGLYPASYLRSELRNLFAPAARTTRTPWT